MEEGAERLRPSTDCDAEGRQRCDVLRMCGNRWQRIPLTMVEWDPETKLNNRTVLAFGGKRPVDIERPFVSTRTREHDDAGHAAAESLLGMLDVQYHLRTQPGRVQCSICRRGASRVATRTWFPLRTTRHRASKNEGAAEGRGPGGLSPVVL